MPTRVGDYFVAVTLGQFLGMRFQDERKMSKSGGSIQAESAHEMEFLLQSPERFWSNVACGCCRVTKLLQINQVRKLNVRYCEKKKRKLQAFAAQQRSLCVTSFFRSNADDIICILCQETQTAEKPY